VLYGTDAIGGVVNVITRRPERDGFHGTIGYRFGEAEEQHKGNALLFGRYGKLDLLLSATARDAGSYRAPEGRFGDITLADETTVHRTGVQDRSIQARIGYALSDRHHVFLRAESYEAEDAGFGFVDPAAYAPARPLIDVTYPRQRFNKLSAGYAATGLGTMFADAVDLTVYGQDNERNLNFDLFQSFGPQAPPGAGVSVKTFNFTDMRTLGMRIEARKLAAEPLLLTYGVDGFRDRSENTDSSVTTVLGFGPPQTEISNTPLVPNASFRSIGAFLQAELTLGERATVIVGGRMQDVRAETRSTPGTARTVEAKNNRTVVGAANLLYRLTDQVALVGSVGRAFRSPNLIEWFFEGVTPEGSGYQVRNSELEPETSLNVDLGARFRSSRLYLEAFAFRNEIRNGIRIASTGTEVNGLPAFKNVNVDELEFRGVELSGELRVLPALALLSSYTHIEAKDELDSESAYGDSYSSKLTGGLRYRNRSDRFWAEYHVRHNGERKDVSLGANPLGDVLPSFTVHGLRGGVTVFQGGAQIHRLGIAVDNLGNVLYAEFSNATFFRPEPRRNVTVTWQVAF
jgi:outer membrane receptor protein involved in Fe transport